MPWDSGHHQRSTGFEFFKSAAQDPGPGVRRSIHSDQLVSIVDTEGNGLRSSKVNLVAPRFHKEERKVQSLDMDKAGEIKDPVE